jgi:hypothetical protein
MQTPKISNDIITTKTDDKGTTLRSQLKLSPRQRQVRAIVGECITWALLIFWTIPVAFVSTLTSLESLVRLHTQRHPHILTHTETCTYIYTHAR